MFLARNNNRIQSLLSLSSLYLLFLRFLQIANLPADIIEKYPSVTLRLHFLGRSASVQLAVSCATPSSNEGSFDVQVKYFQVSHILTRGDDRGDVALTDHRSDSLGGFLCAHRRVLVCLCGVPKSQSCIHSARDIHTREDSRVRVERSDGTKEADGGEHLTALVTETVGPVEDYSPPNPEAYTQREGEGGRRYLSRYGEVLPPDTVAYGHLNLNGFRSHDVDASSLDLPLTYVDTDVASRPGHATEGHDTSPAFRRTSSPPRLQVGRPC